MYVMYIYIKNEWFLERKEDEREGDWEQSLLEKFSG